MNITLTITLAPEVLSLVETLVINLGIGKEPATKKKNTPTTEEKKSEPTSEPKVEEPVTTNPPASKEKITIEKVRLAVQKKASEGKKNDVKTLLTEFGAENVTTLKEENYESFIERIETI